MQQVVREQRWLVTSRENYSSTACVRSAVKDIVGVLDRKGVLAVRNRNPDRFVGERATPELVAQVMRQREGVLESVSLDGIPTLTAFSRSASIGWTAAIGAPLEELYAPARYLLKMAVLWTTVVILVAGLAAAWIAREIIAGVDALVADTEKLGRAEVPTHAPSGLQEVDWVAEAIRGAAEKLQHRERELKDINQTLEQRVTDRTRELVSANRELEDFARVAAHDLRQPLRSMLAFAELLRDEQANKLDDDGRVYLDRVCAAAGRLNGMLEAILAYSTASAAPLAKFERVELDGVLMAVRLDLAERLAKTQGRIESGALGALEGDPHQIHQLLLNLVGNALKFHRPGIPPVVQLESREESSWLRIIVRDNGRGFDPSAVERIFTPFERLQSNVEGSGIGLAIVRRIAERHGDSVTARSEPGAGSQFDVVVPRRMQPPA